MIWTTGYQLFWEHPQALYKVTKDIYILTDTLGDAVSGVIEAFEAVRGRHDVSVQFEMVHGIVDPCQFVGQLVGAVVLPTLHQILNL